MVNDSPQLFSREKALRVVRENQKLAILLTESEKKAKMQENTLNMTHKLIDMITTNLCDEGDLLEVLDQISSTSVSYEQSLENLIKNHSLNKKHLGL